METNTNLKGRKFNGQYYPKINAFGESCGKRYGSYYGHLPLNQPETSRQNAGQN